MQKDCKNKEIKSTERRRFLKLGAGFGITATMVALSRNALASEAESDQIGRKETELKAAAEKTIIMGTAYAPGVSRSYPIMQLDFKENIQNASRGKIYVQLEHSGQVWAHAEMQMTSAGVKLNRLSSDEKAQWKEKVGAHLAIWDDVKKQLAGSLSQFDKFQEAADTPGNYHIPEK